MIPCADSKCFFAAMQNLWRGVEIYGTLIDLLAPLFVPFYFIES